VRRGRFEEFSDGHMADVNQSVLNNVSTTIDTTEMMRKRSTIIKATLILTSALIALYMSACAYVWTQQEHYIFMPQRVIATTPTDYRLPFEDVYITLNGLLDSTERLHAWYIPAADGANKKVLLYLHGSALNIGANIAHAQRFRGMGFSVFLLSYRGYGKSDGTFPSEELIYADAEAAWNHLKEDRDVDPQSIFIYGHSLGGAVAIHLATNHPDAGGLIVEGSFTSIAELARLYPQYRLLPLDLIINQRFDSINKVSHLEVPVLYIHGTSDERVPFEMSQELYSHTTSAKQIKLILGGGHNNTAAIGGNEYLQTVKDFVIFANNHRPSASPDGKQILSRHKRLI